LASSTIVTEIRIQISGILPTLVLVFPFTDFVFCFHDLIVHRRIKFKYTAKSEYMERIMNAHFVHHKVHSKEMQKLSGFFLFARKYDIRKSEKQEIWRK
jgi:hypothetical protein